MADKTSSTTMIDAPKSAIMAVIADFGAYPQWASGVRAAEVEESDSDGLPSRVRFTLDAGVIKDSYLLRYTWSGDDAVSWELVERGSMISDLEGAYRLDAERAGGAGGAGGAAGTQVTYELSVGLAVPMPGIIKRRAEKTIIDTALKGLRGRVEQSAGGSGGGSGGGGK